MAVRATHASAVDGLGWDVFNKAGLPDILITLLMEVSDVSGARLSRARGIQREARALPFSPAQVFIDRHAPTPQIIILRVQKLNTL